ncbi:MAG: M23 family metallopeptidase [Magnetococcales bacterium]|nr:M23 family metallopeptidase [Magnetococcales bacterium]
MMIRVPVFCLLLSLGLLPTPVRGAGLALSGPLVPGSAVLLAVTGAPSGARFSAGRLGGQEFPLTDDGRALLALDMETPKAALTLTVTVTAPNGVREVLKKKVAVPARKYKEEHLSLPKGKVDLAPQALARAETETRAIQATYERRGGRPGFLEGFRLPVAGARVSGVFGSRRILNGQPRRPHNGVDLAAPRGTLVVAIAPGVVALTGRDYFFTGNTVAVDHGHGIISLYAHLDEIRVTEGAWLPAGTVLGSLGMTGRATGPHLHYGVMVRKQRVDPLRLPGVEP